MGVEGQPHAPAAGISLYVRNNSEYIWAVKYLFIVFFEGDDETKRN